MAGPAWLSDALAAVMLVIAAYSVGRLAAAAPMRRRSERDVDAFHVAMGVSMAAMLTNGLTRFSADAWAILFACTTVWFVLCLPWTVANRATRRSSLDHCISHLLSSGAMVYMLLALPVGMGKGGSMRGVSAMAMGSTKLPFLALMLALVISGDIAVYAYRSFFRRIRHSPSGGVLDLSDAEGLSVPLVRSGSTSASAPTASLVVTRRPQARAPEPAPFLAPHLAAAAQVVMGLVMAYMLFTMV